MFLFGISGCSENKEGTPEPESGKASLSAKQFAQLYFDLQGVDRKNSKILDSFLKRNHIDDGEYRLVADSVFIESNPRIIEEYKKITTRYEDEKNQTFDRYGIEIKQYEEMLLVLSTGERPDWADSVATVINDSDRE
ncbi:MAG: hypothetical protein GY855_01805 [candidate division Zixibacteria bacterium]|nr:hypothetical protein [candidate division Zixibacteria bacterium]